MRRVILGLLTPVALGCGRAASAPERASAPEPVCPEAVQIFSSPDRVGAQYEELGPLASGEAMGDTLLSRKERAAAMGANGILLGGSAPLAIYIPSDMRAVRDICAGGDPRMVRAMGAASPDAVGYAMQGRSTPPADTAAVLPATTPPPAAKPERVPPVDPGRQLTSNRELRQALADVTRLRIVTEYREVRPGLLALTLGAGYSSAESVEYNLSRLERAYGAFLSFEPPIVILELWRDGRKIGEYTRDGLFLGSRFSRPR
jgi:hypothetical protein